MNLKDLTSTLNNCKKYNFSKAHNIKIEDISFDSRNISKTSIFVAISGLNVDGHDYIKEAIKKGASAILLEKEEYTKGIKIPVIVVKNNRITLSKLAARFYGYPARKMKIIGVTGTDGKTTTSTIIYKILRTAGKKVGTINSINTIIDDKIYETGKHTTTPDAVTIQRILNRMYNSNTEITIIETSSHGLSQYRVHNCDFDIAVITNISPEHLDYHKNLNGYIKAKSMLFSSLIKGYHKKNIPKISILNKDDSSFDLLKKYQADKIISYGLDSPADFSAQISELNTKRMILKIKNPLNSFTISTKLLGKYNISNILAAIATVKTLNISNDIIKQTLSSFTNIKGRMEIVHHNSEGFTVIIDFAHTPNALKKALESAKIITKNNLIVVFGCAGLRDKSKRKKMGKIAGKYADKIYLTAEDPRTEKVEDIINEIAVGCIIEKRIEGIDFFKIPKREKAIETAILSASTGDTVITCGKAHESTMCYGNRELAWNEYKAVEKALNKKKTEYV